MSTPGSLQTTENTLAIVEALKEFDGAGVTQLANHLEMSKSTVHDHLSTLRDNNYVVKEGTEYRIGLGFFEIGEYARNQYDLYQIARPEIQELAENTGELANLLVEEHGRGVYIYQARGEKAVTLDTHVGKRRYLHNTALGKAILSQLPERRVHEILDRHGMPQANSNTVTDRERLFEQLERIREKGIAKCNQERVDGLLCVAAPITTNSGDLKGAISVSGPATRIQGDEYDERIPRLVQQAANVIQINISMA